LAVGLVRGAMVTVWLPRLLERAGAVRKATETASNSMQISEELHVVVVMAAGVVVGRTAAPGAAMGKAELCICWGWLLWGNSEEELACTSHEN